MENRSKLGYQQGIVSILVNTLLFVLKYWAGIVSGSVALIADAWHTLSDSFSSLIVIGSVKLSSRKPTPKHPFGFGRWEQIAAFFISFLLAIVAYEFIRESIDKLRLGESANYGLVAIWVTVASVLAKEGLAQYSFWAYRKTQNPSIKADGWHHRSDALSSLAILAGIFLHPYIWWIDGALGILISLLLLYAVYEILKDTITKLLGVQPSDELIKQVKKIIHEKHGQELRAHHFHIHNYGTHNELTFHVKLEDTIDIKTGHAIATGIEKEILKGLGIVATTHIEPKNVSGH
jgi:cation diffusion facilitator family transporter